MISKTEYIEYFNSKAGDIEISLSPNEKAEVCVSLENLKMLVKHNKALTREDPSYKVRHFRVKVGDKKSLSPGDAGLPHMAGGQWSGQAGGRHSKTGGEEN